jgi:hypothetical protein
MTSRANGHRQPVARVQLVEAQPEIVDRVEDAGVALG